MALNITSLLNGRLHKIEFEYTIENTEDNAIIPPSDVSFTAPISVSGYVDDAEGYYQVYVRSSIDYRGSCARCLEDVFGTFVLEFNRTVVPFGTLQNELNEEYIVVKGGLLDIDRLIVEELLLEFPSRLLCKEECAGLCTVCGQNLNHGQCSCPK
ncbi:MAG: DUF177 domain-containing protein [Clostridia bacterium]|nr:DUF177 domain-containing protein [Clostridia bacterium]